MGIPFVSDLNQLSYKLDRYRAKRNCDGNFLLEAHSGPCERIEPENDGVQCDAVA
jgi:hypothetical protein